MFGFLVFVVIFFLYLYFKYRKPKKSVVENSTLIERFKIPRFKTKKSDFIYVIDTNDYSDERRYIKTVEDYETFINPSHIQLEIESDSANELFYGVKRKFLLKYQETLDLNKENIKDLSVNFQEYFEYFIDGSYKEEYVLDNNLDDSKKYDILMSLKKVELEHLIVNHDETIKYSGTKDKLVKIIIENNFDDEVYIQNSNIMNEEEFNNLLDKLSICILNEIKELVGGWHIFGQRIIYESLSTEYKPLADKLEVELKRLK